MKRPRICLSIVSDDLKAVKEVEPFVDLFEVRIDLVGDGWLELVKHLNKPWIACNRRADEGGNWRGSESKRVKELLQAVELGADMVDIELATENLGEIVPLIKKRAQCLLSFHDIKGTPASGKLKEIVRRQLDAGADICKVVTTAQRFEDNLTVLQVIREFPRVRVVSFAMGPLGFVSRIFCPLLGGDFVYASIDTGKEAAPGQITVGDLRKIYAMVKEWKRA